MISRSDSCGLDWLFYLFIEGNSSARLFQILPKSTDSKIAFNTVFFCSVYKMDNSIDVLVLWDTFEKNVCSLVDLDVIGDLNEGAKVYQIHTGRNDRVQTNNPNTIKYKMSHLQNDFHILDLQKGVRTNSTQNHAKFPSRVKERAQLSAEKYADLMSLCSGPTPVFKNSDHVNFFKNLPHKSQ